LEGAKGGTSADMLLSTLRSYVEAMGGSLRLVAEFPDGVAELSSLGEDWTLLLSAAPKAEADRRRGGVSPLVHAND
jgi:hypothetical protein